MNLNDKFSKNAIFMFFAASFSSLTNLIYQLVLVRNLTEIEYGILSSLISLLLIIAMPIAAFRTMVIKFISAFNIREKINKISSLFFIFLKHNLFIGLIIVGLVLLLREKIAYFLNIGSDIYINYLASILFLSAIYPVLSGFLQGMEKFYWEGTISIISGLIKIIFTFIFVKAGLNIIGGLVGFMISLLLGIMLYVLPIREVIIAMKDRVQVEVKEIKEMYCYFIPSMLFMLTMMALTNIDMVLVKHFFSPQDAGNYAIAQFIGKILFFIPSPIALVLFPRAANLLAEEKQHHHVLNKALLFSALLCFACISVYNLFPANLLGLITGKSNPASVLLGRLFSVAMSLFGIVNVVSFYLLSVNNFKFIKFLILATVLQTLAILLFHSTLAAVLIVLCVSSATLFLIFMRISWAEA
ncbi:MAG: oligosaccharide flippase family protein [Candidatus Omnitrophica bacterium]|nr:oligosaccharide flippase family protein [Candidatus Omnitrophota bacterium]HOX54691.1 oligosaccharide flippase family protein [Candidatus Omnitrophota bacterium]